MPAPPHLDWSPQVQILTFTTLYPSAARPQHGIFVETRLRKLVESGRVEARIVAPCPWFPFASEHFGAYAAMARIPREETRHGLHIDHPRYPLLPKIGMSSAPLALFAAALPWLRRQIGAGHDFDLIDAHYFYPDGVAAVLLGRALGRLVAARWPLQGVADHGVSEALYLRDPDGNGLELYWDRPRDQWPRGPDGGVAMYTHPLDLGSLLAAK